MAKMMPRVTPRSHSVHPAARQGSEDGFAGFPDVPAMSAKVRLAGRINHLLDERKLSQMAAAKILGVGQPKVSALRNYRLAGFSLERLMRFMKALGQDVHIVPRSSSGRRGSLASAGRSSVNTAPSGIIPGVAKSPREKWSWLLASVEKWTEEDRRKGEDPWPQILRNLNTNRMSYRSRG